MYFMLFLFLFMYETILIVNLLIMEFLKTQKQTFTYNLHGLIEGKCDTTLVFITYIRVWKRQIVQNYELNSLFIIMQR